VLPILIIPCEVVGSAFKTLEGRNTKWLTLKIWLIIEKVQNSKFQCKSNCTCVIHHDSKSTILFSNKRQVVSNKETSYGIYNEIEVMVWFYF